MVSAIVPTTLSRRRFWPDVLQSFIDQTYTDKELVFIVDNADEVNALAELVDAVTSEAPVRITSGGLTLGDKRNVGCATAFGSIVLHFDDDDLYSPGRIADQVATLERTGKALTGYVSATVQELRTVSVRDNGAWRQTSGWWQLHSDYLMGGSLAYLKSWWSAHPFESINIGEDTAFIDTASTALQCVAGDSGLDYYCIRNHHTNTSGRCITEDCIEIAHGGIFDRATIQ